MFFLYILSLRILLKQLGLPIPKVGILWQKSEESSQT